MNAVPAELGADGIERSVVFLGDRRVEISISIRLLQDKLTKINVTVVWERRDGG